MRLLPSLISEQGPDRRSRFKTLKISICKDFLIARIHETKFREHLQILCFSDFPFKNCSVHGIHGIL